MKIGYVFYDQIFAGKIIQEDDGTFCFEYDKNYFENPSSKPISLTLPLSNRTYNSNILFPFFDGLIPEGYLLEVALRKYKLKDNDRMSLLLKTCKDPIGIVSIREEM
jgi:serine/threonine-protein kinase HipA